MSDASQGRGEDIELEASLPSTLEDDVAEGLNAGIQPSVRALENALSMPAGRWHGLDGKLVKPFQELLDVVTQHGRAVDVYVCPSGGLNAPWAMLCHHAPLKSAEKCHGTTAKPTNATPTAARSKPKLSPSEAMTQSIFWTEIFHERLAILCRKVPVPERKDAFADIAPPVLEAHSH